MHAARGFLVNDDVPCWELVVAPSRRILRYGVNTLPLMRRPTRAAPRDGEMSGRDIQDQMDNG